MNEPTDKDVHTRETPAEVMDQETILAMLRAADSECWQLGPEDADD